MKFEIYQIKDIENCRYSFMSYDTAIKNNFNFDRDYKKVYEGKITESNNTLEDIYVSFNIGYHKDFNGRSLSISDVVSLEGDRYYCDMCGWKKLN